MGKGTGMSRYFFAIIVLAGLLSACSAYRTRVIDTPESRGLKGWQKPYTVNGKRYDPLLGHEGFAEEGLASWYGNEFHGGATSNGEIYDMHALTAAHKTLPMGVYVKVRNKNNGKEVIVRINDRGPFVGDRIIDLSFAAARQLEITDAGTAPVRIVALGYDRQSGNGRIAYRSPASYDVGDFAIQIAAFSEPANAERLAQRMRKLYGTATIRKAMVNGSRFFRVQVGSFASLKEAEDALSGLEDRGFKNGFVVALD